MIGEFIGDNRFLSNFWPVLGSLTAEHLYQAAKTPDIQAQRAVLMAHTPGTAKRLGRSMPIRRDWEDIKLDVMLGVLRWKFSFPELRQLLRQTGNHELVEGNHWHDLFWGICLSCNKHVFIMQGENHLGKALMKVREEICQ